MRAVQALDQIVRRTLSPWGVRVLALGLSLGTNAWAAPIPSLSLSDVGYATVLNAPQESAPEPAKVAISQNFWPFWSYRKFSDGGELTYIPSPIDALLRRDSDQREDAERMPLSLYSCQKSPDGAVTQGFIFQLVQARGGSADPSLTVGPLLRLSNATRESPRVELLGGLLSVGSSADGQMTGLGIMGAQAQTDWTTLRNKRCGGRF